MKQQDIDYIKKICNEKHTKKIWATRAQVMAKNIKPINEASGGGKISFDVLESFLKSMVKKYGISVGSILTITDINGSMTYHAGIVTSYKNEKTGKSDWLFTVHADTMYELYVKLVLMTFVTIKEGRVEKRKEPVFKEG